MESKKTLAIIGGGVAGLSAAIYARRANVDVVIFESLVAGGLVATLDKIENYPGFSTIDGFELSEKMFKQAAALGAKFKYEQVLSVSQNTEGSFLVTTNAGEYNFHCIIVATGTKHNKLGVEDDFVGRGVSYCATCDGSFFKDEVVAVAGNLASTVREALYLSGVCKKVFVLCPTKTLKVDALQTQNLISQGNVEIVFEATITSLHGEQKLTSLIFRDGKTNEDKTLEVSALFVAVGSAPAVDFLSQLNIETKNGFLQTDEKMSTSIAGIFAAGDVTAGNLKQIVTACSDGAKAGSFAAGYLKRQTNK